MCLDLMTALAFDDEKNRWKKQSIMCLKYDVLDCALLVQRN